MDGRTDGCMDGRTDGRADGRTGCLAQFQLPQLSQLQSPTLGSMLGGNFSCKPIRTAVRVGVRVAREHAVDIMFRCSTHELSAVVKVAI